MLVIMMVAGGFAAGVWIMAGAVWPPPRPLSAALSHLRSTGRQRSAFVSADGLDESLALSIGRWIVRRLRGNRLADEQTVSDLELVGRPLELYAGTVALSVIAGASAGPALWALAASAGSPLPFVVPVWFMLIGAVGGWIVPRLTLRSEAAQARSDFRHALGAYLDVLVLLLAAQEGPESAMDLAARAGQGPAFAELRRAVWQARLSGDAVWDALDDLGRRLRVTELREIAAAGSLAGESGAAVRQSLTAKARAMRQSALADAEATARKKSQALFAPLVLMGLGFVIFLIYPMVTNLSVGGSG
jgi:pilus assembly protein TadC